jgi:hypothetical protein
MEKLSIIPDHLSGLGALEIMEIIILNLFTENKKLKDRIEELEKQTIK